MTRKEILQLVDENCKALEASDKTFASIYKIMFRFTENVLAESNDGFRIQKFTYGETQKRIEEISKALYARIGATHAYVALEMENCLEWIIAFWAILRSGNRPYLVNCRHPKVLSSGILKSLSVQYIIATSEGELPGEYIVYKELEKAVSEAANTGALGEVPMEVFENELALSTSATSLKEVVCFYSGREFSAQLMNTKGILAQNMRVSIHYKGALKQLAFLPFYHIFGLVAVYFWFTYFGRTLVFMKDYAPETILNTVRRHEVTHIFAVPMLWHTIEKTLRKQLSKEDEKTQRKFEKGLKLATKLQNIWPNWGARMSKKILSQVTDQLFGPSVIFCISGGSYLKQSTLELINGLGYSLHNGYGMSEIGITSVELRDKPKACALNSIGRPFDSVEYRIAEDGTLEVRGDSICYAMMINGERMENHGWFSTQDVMEQGEDGYYYIRGRKGDSVIGENGENINPDVVEQLFQLPDARCFSVLGLAGEDNMETLSMIVSVNPYLSQRKLSAMVEEIHRVNETLPMAGRIRQFYFTQNDLAPETAIKIGRQYVLRGLKEGTIQLTAFADYQALEQSASEELGGALVEKVREIIAEKLEISTEQVTLDAHLMYDLGADSLQYFAIVTALSEEFSISGYNNENHYRYTLREISEYIEENM